MISGAIISLVGFDDPAADPAQLYGGQTIIEFGWIHVALSFTLPIFSTVMVLLYDIDRGKHEGTWTPLAIDLPRTSMLE